MRRRRLGLERLEPKRLLAGDLTNPLNPLDVNNDTNVTANDALVVLNHMGRIRSGGEGEAVAAARPFLDVNGDSRVTAGDALMIINSLAEGEEVSGPAANLQVTSIERLDPDQDGTLVFRVGTSNVGSIDPNFSGVQIEFFDPETEQRVAGPFGEPISVRDTGPLSPVLISVPRSQLPDGTFEVRSTIDPFDNVDETDEDDNQRSITTTVGSGDEIPQEPVMPVVPSSPLVIPGLRFRDGSSPRIEYDGIDLSATVTSPAAGQLTFTARGSSVTIPIRRDLVIDISGHNNELVFDNAVIPDDLIIRVSGSGNSFALLGTDVGDDFRFSGGERTDIVLLGAGTRIADDAVINTKRGEDEVVIDGALVGDDLIIRMGDGRDVLAVDGVQVGDDAIVRMGDDNDSASVANALIRDVADIEGDGDRDTFFADLGSIEARRYRPSQFETVGSRIDVAIRVDQLLDTVFAFRSGLDSEFTLA